jgi:sialate O-acetylesterase
MSRRIFAVLCVAAVLSVVSMAIADVKLPAVIGDNMVIQQGIPFKIWGWADAGEKVTVTLGKATADATADDKGKWMVKLEALKASSDPADMTIAGKNTLTVKNVLVGEVWVCSGQSNMEFTTGGAINAKEEIAKADYPTIRLFNIAPTKHLAAKPEDDVKAKWEACSPTTVPNFSAVAYFFGRELNEKLKVPVGLINSPWGGSPVEQWIPMETYNSDPELADFPPRIEAETKNFPKVMENYTKQLEDWKSAREKTLATRPAAATQPGVIPNPPWQPQPPENNYGAMYNGNIAPVINYAIKGAIWYQGESNAGNWMGYRKSFPAMIRGWRKVWGQGDFPFLYVQLANFMNRPTDPNVQGTWAELREAQTMTLSLTNTGMAVIIDVGNPTDIHPKDKQTVGHRLAVIAEAQSYGMKDVVYSGPMFDSLKVEGNKVRLSFKHVGGGLVAKSGKLTGFAVAGADGKYVWADATIDGETVVVSSDKVASPVMVRYAWGNDPECSLYNKADLPASPFRAGEPEPKPAK